MQTFLARHQPQIQGTISGFDRLRFFGQMRMLSFVDGLAAFLSRAGVLLKHFGDYAEDLSDQIKQASIRIAEATPLGRVHYLESSAVSKEEVVHQLPPPQGGTGLAAVLSCVEPCRSYEVQRNPATKHLELKSALRKCLHYYFYTLRGAECDFPG